MVDYLDLGNVPFTPVPVTANWNSAANAVSDIETKTGMDLSAPNHTVFLFLWEGPGSDDCAVLKVAKTTGTASWTDMYASGAGFDTPPTGGFTLLVGVALTG